jgi:hypothetical protein
MINDNLPQLKSILQCNQFTTTTAVEVTTAQIGVEGNGFWNNMTNRIKLKNIYCLFSDTSTQQFNIVFIAESSHLAQNVTRKVKTPHKCVCVFLQIKNAMVYILDAVRHRNKHNINVATVDFADTAHVTFPWTDVAIDANYERFIQTTSSPVVPNDKKIIDLAQYDVFSSSNISMSPFSAFDVTNDDLLKHLPQNHEKHRNIAVLFSSGR